MNKDPGKKRANVFHNVPADLPADIDAAIRIRAYELYEACGRKNGHDLDDWLRAEEEIKQQKTGTVAA